MAIYLSKQSGLWSSASTWLTGMPSSTFSTNGAMSAIGDSSLPPQSGARDKIIIRGANTVVTYDVNGEFGDGTATQSNTYTEAGVLNNAIVLSGGKLQASRTTSTSLTSYGSITLNKTTTPWFDWGTTSDPVSAVTANLVFGSASLSATVDSAKYGLYGWNSQVSDYTGTGLLESHSITIVGKTKTRNTRLDGFHASGTSQLTVLDCTGWEVGDRIVVEIPHLSAPFITNTIGNITNISGNVVTINPALNANCPAGVYVGNFSSNITIRPGVSAVGGLTNNACNSHGIQFNTNGNNSLYEFKNFSMVDFQGSNAINIGAVYARRNVVIDGISIHNVLGLGSGNGITFTGGVGYEHVIKNYAHYHPNGSAYAYNFGASAMIYCYDSVCYRSGYTASIAQYYYVYMNNVRAWATSANFGPQVWGLNFFADNCHFRCGFTSNNNPTIFNASYFNIKNLVTNSYLQVCTPSNGGNSPTTVSEGSAGTYEIRNCTLSSVSVSVNGLPTGKDFASNFYSVNGNTMVNRRVNSWYSLSGNYSMRNRGVASYEMVALKLNLPFFFYEKIPSKAGIPQRFVGYLRYQPSYGNDNLPYIKFTDDSNTSSVTQTFSCSPSPNTWQKFDLTVTPVSDGNLTMTVNAQTSSSVARVYLDGLSFDPINPKSRHYGFVFNDTLPYQTVNTLTTLTENEVATLATTLNLDHLYDAASYWSVSNPGATSYTDLLTANGSLLDFGNKNFIINNTGSGFSYNSGTNTITLNSPVLSAGNNFDTIKTTGTITLNTGKISYIDVDANIVQDTPTSLSGVYVANSAKTYTYNTNTATEVEFKDCNIYGLQNVGNAIVTVKKTGTTTITESDAEIVTYAPTLINLTLQGGYVALYDNTSTRQYYQNTDGTIVLPAAATGTWTYKVARYGYELFSGSFSVSPNIGDIIDINPSYVPDTFITVTSASVVSAYTDLDSTAKIHDYLSYIRTTSDGIDYGPLHTQSFGTLTFNAGLTLNATASSVFDYTGAVITLKSSAIIDNLNYFIDGNFTQSNGNTISNGIKIRSTNLDSEFYFSSVDSLTFYPTLSDRDNNTNPGPVIGSGTSIYRYLYGGPPINGVTFSNNAYIRVTAGGTTLLNTTALAPGTTNINFGDTGNIQLILNNQKIINQGVQKASKLIPHSTNI